MRKQEKGLSEGGRPATATRADLILVHSQKKLIQTQGTGKLSKREENNKIQCYTGKR